MRFKCFLLLTGLGLIFGATVSLGQPRNPSRVVRNLGGLGQLRGGDRAPAPSAPSPGSPSDGRRGAAVDAEAEAEFRGLDANGDGLLNSDEMDDTLRAERDKWDTNGDGFIDLNEFKEYYKARRETEEAARLGGSPGELPRGSSAAKARAGSLAPDLPPNLPPWFQQRDTDGDGQIGLYEWTAAGQPIAEFLAMDLNGDGFLTVDEVLWAVGGKANNEPKE
jgi:hypothetical protein